MTGAQVWVLDRRVFQQVMMRTGLKRLEDNMQFLTSVPLLSNLHNDHLSRIADALEVVSNNRRSPSLSELTPMIFNIGLTHLSSEASNLSFLLYRI